MGEFAEYEREIAESAELNRRFKLEGLGLIPGREMTRIAEELIRTPRRRVRDWHRQWDEREPPCAGNQWRTKDRPVVVNLHDMEDHHLGHAIRFATTKLQHASRLGALLTERKRRGP